MEKAYYTQIFTKAIEIQEGRRKLDRQTKVEQALRLFLNLLENEEPENCWLLLASLINIIESEPEIKNSESQARILVIRLNHALDEARQVLIGKTFKDSEPDQNAVELSFPKLQFDRVPAYHIVPISTNEKK